MLYDESVYTTVCGIHLNVLFYEIQFLQFQLILCSLLCINVFDIN